MLAAACVLTLAYIRIVEQEYFISFMSIFLFTGNKTLLLL